MTTDPRSLAFDALPSAIVVWEYDPPLISAGDLRLVAANRATEASGPRWPTGFTQLDDLYVEVARTGETRHVRGLRDSSGAIFDVRVFALAPDRLAVSFDNVTEGRQIEEAHRAIFERTHDTILIIDPDTEVVLETNPAAQTVYGRDIVGLSMHELSLSHRPGMSERIINAGFVHFETTHRRADGAPIHLDVHARPIVREGRTVVAGISRDITEQVEARRALLASEEKHRTIVENVPVILWTIDAAGGMEFLSGGIEGLSGYTSEEASRSLWNSRIDPADHARLSAAYRALFEAGTRFEVEYRFLRKDGRWAWFLDQSGRIYEKDGRRLADGLTQDITDRKRGELQQLALAELGRRALAETDAQALMDDACRTAAAAFEVPMASVLLHDAAEDAFLVAATFGVVIAPGFRVPNHPDRLAAQTFLADQAISYDNVPEERRFDTTDLRRLDTRAGMCVPISGRQRRFGVLHAHTNEPRSFTAREMASLQAMANVLAEALHRSGAERELERRQLQLANAQELAHVGSLEVEVDTGHIDCSDEMYRIAGLVPQSREMDVAYVTPMLPAEVRGLLSPSHPQLARGEIVEVDHEVHAADGRTRIVHSRVRLVVDRITGRQKIVASVQDITEKREADAALRDRERRLQLIVSRLPVILWSTDADLGVNSLTGAGFEPIREMSDATRFRLPDLISDPPGGPEEGAPAALRGQSVSYETTHGTRELRVHVEPLRDDRGDVAGTVGIAFDVTEQNRVNRAHSALLEQLHHAAEEWRETFDSIQAPIVITDDDACVVRMNAAALRLSRHREYTDAAGQALELLGTDAIWKELDAVARASAVRGEAISMQGVVADGRSWDLLASRSARGQTIIIASDVTELVSMQDKLLRTERMSQMGALVAGVAHEVRNPLFGISATLDAFENHYDMEEFREYIAALRDQVDRMSQLMHELLEYGRPFASVLHPYCIATVVNGSVANAGTLASRHHVTLQSSVPPSLVAVPMDRPRMAQVFDNLIANAIQHSRAGGVVSISAAVADGGRWARITVEDRGPGFREDDLLRVFEPFFTRRRGGTGLGLSVVQRIIDEHGGMVVASNREGGGATMVVTLPVAGAVA